MKKLIRLFTIAVIIYLCFWFANNLDFESVFTTSLDAVKCEFSYENIMRALRAFQEAIK